MPKIDNPKEEAPPNWDEYIGHVGEDTHVGLVFSTAWTIRVKERYHDQSELSPEQAGELISLIEDAKERLEYVRDNWDQLESEYRNVSPNTP